MTRPVTPYRNDPAPKKQQVAGMFDRIAGRYDFLNHLLSFGIDKYWRKVAVDCFRDGQAFASGGDAHILDVATGTADLALEAAKRGIARITGVDISENMLEIGRKKIAAKNLSAQIDLQTGDSEQLQFAANRFSGVMVAFGVRNFANLDRGLREIHRVLKPGGKAVVLEFSRPGVFPFRQLYSFYFANILPRIGGAFSSDREAYSYLHRSVISFPDGRDFLDRLENAGFTRTTAKPLTLGVCTVYTALKKLP